MAASLQIAVPVLKILEGRGLHHAKGGQSLTVQLSLSSASELYRELGIKRIPLYARSKKPAFKLLAKNSEGKSKWKIPLPDEELDRIFEEHPDLNIGCMLGVPPDYPFEVDFDDPGTFDKFTFNGEVFKDRTLTYLTGRGYKVLAFSDKPLDFTKIDFRPYLEMELRGNNCYTVLPPSIHPNGKRYTVLGTWQIQVMKDAKAKVLKRALELGWKIPDANIGGTSGISGTPKRRRRVKRNGALKDEEISEIVQTVRPLWVQPYRNEVCLSLIGYLIKSGVQEEDTHKIIDQLTNLTGDEERSSRLSSIRYHYHNRTAVDLKGWSGLRSVTRTLRKEGVLPD